MCGIAGFINKKMNNDERVSAILAMNDRMIHRGPDAGGYFISDVVLGHRRLSIQDLTETGSQPATSHNDRYVIVFNGEIYNAPSIRKRLCDEGHVSEWRGTSDTEVLLETISAYGIIEALKISKGMLAIAVYDKKDRRLFLARDRVGEKPLYYGIAGTDVVFASDIDVIRAYPGFAGEIDPKALGLFLRYGFIPAPHSIYKGIYKLIPGTVCEIAVDNVGEQTDDHIFDNISTYYDLAAEYRYGKNEGRFTGSFAEATDELERSLKDAIEGQMLSDVPLGAFLSGGIDSTSVVAIMQSISDRPVRTFTIGFDEEEYDESGASGAIAKALGTDHTCLMISEKDLTDVVPKMADIFTEPFGDSSQIPTYLVSRLARQKVTVSLSGDAGDELFGGYNTYWKVAGLYNRLSPYPSWLKRSFGSLLSNSSNNRLYRTAHCLKSKDIANLHEAVCYDFTDMLDSYSGRTDRESYASHYEQKLLLRSELSNGTAAPEDEMMLRDMLKYHPDDILVKVDRAGMAVSLENRVPMLDVDVLRLAFSLPVEYKIGRDSSRQIISKYVLKEMLYRYIPKEMMDRPKKGFSVPLQKWLSEGTVHDMAWSILSDSKLVRDGYLDREWLNRLMTGFLRTKENKGLLWNVFVLEQWYRKYHCNE